MVRPSGFPAVVGLPEGEMGGWEAEAEASNMLQGLGLGKDLHYSYMRELIEADKIKVLLAQALFGKPDNLLLDEPTNGLDAAAIEWLSDFILNEMRQEIPFGPYMCISAVIISTFGSDMVRFYVDNFLYI